MTPGGVYWRLTLGMSVGVISLRFRRAVVKLYSPSASSSTNLAIYPADFFMVQIAAVKISSSFVMCCILKLTIPTLRRNGLKYAGMSVLLTWT